MPDTRELLTEWEWGCAVSAFRGGFRCPGVPVLLPLDDHRLWLEEKTVEMFEREMYDLEYTQEARWN
jgi:hypothetical protein